MRRTWLLIASIMVFAAAVGGIFAVYHSMSGAQDAPSSFAAQEETRSSEPDSGVDIAKDALTAAPTATTRGDRDARADA